MRSHKEPRLPPLHDHFVGDNMMERRGFKATIDRFAGDFAVLLVRDDEDITIDFPASLLPAGCVEGDIIDIEIGKDEQATADARERVTALLEKLKRKG